MANEGTNNRGRRLLISLGVAAILLVEVLGAYYLNNNMVVPKYIQSAGKGGITSQAGGASSESGVSSSGADSSEMYSETSMPDGDPSPAVFNSNIYMIDNLIINPAGSQGGRYVAMSLGLGVHDKKILEELENRDIQIRDAIIALLSQKTLGKFIAIEERLKLKQEILDLVNHKMNTNKVSSIYFTEYVIQ